MSGYLEAESADRTTPEHSASLFDSSVEISLPHVLLLLESKELGLQKLDSTVMLTDSDSSGFAAQLLLAGDLYQY